MGQLINGSLWPTVKTLIRMSLIDKNVCKWNFSF